MSGGAFDYAYIRVDQFADELESRLDDEEGRKLFSSRILVKLREIHNTVRHTAKLMKEVEWLYSGDTGEETFLERIEQQGEPDAK